MKKEKNHCRRCGNEFIPSYENQEYCYCSENCDWCDTEERVEEKQQED